MILRGNPTIATKLRGHSHDKKNQPSVHREKLTVARKLHFIVAQIRESDKFIENSSE